MKNNEIEKFSYASINIIIREILDLPIIIPRLIFDYNSNPNITNGYYMYQNVSGDIITLNMHSLMTLKTENDIKTVITYGFIHEIMHMYQPINTKYKTDKEYYSYIEDTADYATILYIRNNKKLIDTKLNIIFNDIFLNGIERQLKYKFTEIQMSNRYYISKIIAGTLSTKLNFNFDYLYNLLINSNSLTIVFPNHNKYYIDLDYTKSNELSIVLNLLYLTNFGMIRPNFVQYIGEYSVAQLIFYLF